MKRPQMEAIQVWQALRKVFRHPSYIALAGLVTIAIVIIAIWLPNLSFLRHTATSSNFTPSQKIDIFWSSLGAIQTNFTTLSRTMTILVAILSGMNIALFTFYLKTRRKIERSMGTSAMGTLAGLLGVGCTACGSVIISSVFGVGATAGVVGILPFNGAEFGIAGTALLLWANYSLSKKILAPLTCSNPTKL